MTGSERAEANELALVAFERSRSPTVIADCRLPDMPIVLANPAFLRLSGYAAHEVLGRNCRFLQGEGTSESALAEIRAAISGARSATVELINYRKGGQRFLNRLTLSPIFDATGGLIYFFGSQRDVTRRRKIKELEDTQKVLLREVDHRAMNALALVQAIVGLSKTDSVEGYAASVRGRVQALARAHAALAGAGWGAAPLADLVAGELAASADGRLTLEGPPVAIRARLVQPLVLILHELSANAVRHGALSSPAGGLRVSWRHEASSNKVTLRWEETGGPAPAGAPIPGVGGSVAKALVERQLLGALTQTWLPKGLVTEIAFVNSGD